MRLQKANSPKRGPGKAANRKAALSAQQTIPYLVMHPDGVCQLPGGLYTKTVEYEDINYSVASTEDQTAIFSGWSSFLNYFDSSLPFQLSFINRRSRSRNKYRVNIPQAQDDFNSVRAEFTGMLKNQIARSNNGIERSKYITFGLPAEGIGEARPRLERVEADVMGNLKRLGVPSGPMDGKDRLALLHSQMHPGSREPFRFSWQDIPKTGLGTKDYIAPDSFDFRQSRLFRVGQYWGAASYLQIMASELSDKLLAEILELDAELTVTMHIQTVDQLKAIKTIKGKISDIGKMKVEEQRKAVRAGYDPDILPPDLITFSKDAAELLADLEGRTKEQTGIRNMKVGYNKVFGYYIDIPNSAGVTELPEDYIRKQTLVSSERYFTHELKDLENTLLTARERIAELEYSLFNEVRQLVAGEVARVQAAADAVARLDALCSLAETAVKNHYVCPEVDLSRTLDIREGRHPVVEQAQKDNLFVPNDTFLNDADDRVAIVTGPNMAGKSTYMRQTALIVLMAQMGSFVPAKSAVIGVVDRVFTRIGASDDLAAGQSTFMVEMSEMANILRHATAQSLLILDEIGRGTSTYDGMAIARAVLEYCADPRRLGAKTMFATHYHELTALEQTLPGVRNYNITAKKQGGTLLFLRKIVAGAADDSYGIEVAKLAGVPDAIITKAKTYLRELESGAAEPAAPAHTAQDAAQMTIGDAAGDEIAEQLRSIDLNTITPLEAMRLLFELQQKARG